MTTAIHQAEADYKKEKSQGANPDEARRIVRSKLIKTLAQFNLEDDLREEYLIEIETELDSIRSRNDPPILDEIRLFEKEVAAQQSSSAGYAITNTLLALKQDLEKLKWDLTRATYANPGIKLTPDGEGRPTIPYGT